jgi:alanyl-tRNA synthetase
MTSREIRASFLAFFERHGHRVVPSAPLVPHDDPTLLFTNAGMNQFKDVFLGRDRRPYTRAATAQKCMRVSGKHNDLDNVGPSLRHHTFFEMLGNFSFGDYFKREAIPFAWTLLTAEWGLPPERLFATVFRGDGGIPRDDEAHGVWRSLLPADRIGELGVGDNFWQMGETGPCGRCSEIYYFRGPDLPCSREAAGGRCRGLECDCDRFVEIWNNVFMEFDRQADGRLAPLPAPSIDTGMGLERVTAVLQGTLSNYDTDVFAPLLADLAARTGAAHRGTLAPPDVSMRVVADHLRAMTFLIADGVAPSNEWRGYVLRKIMRRAMRHGRRLGLTEPFLHQLSGTVVDAFGGAYPELRAASAAVAQTIRREEERFDAVLTAGLPRLEEVLDRAAAAGGRVAGEAAFRLYDTYGLPRDFIEDMIEDRRLAFDAEGFERAMEGQREKARAKSDFRSKAPDNVWAYEGGLDKQFEACGDAGVFVGYDSTRVEAPVWALFDLDGRQVTRLDQGSEGFVVLRQTPFYLEAGGQVSDSGTITSPEGDAEVTAMLRPVPGWPRFHRVQVTRGAIREGEPVAAAVSEHLRNATRRNHTATHLLHAALRTTLGPHVKQAGSLVAPDRLRFDLLHTGPLSPEELLAVERLVNERILDNSAVRTDIRTTSEAIADGAIALFGEKYGETVRVVSIPGFSVELCGGTHVRATGDIGPFVIVSEGGVAAGVRRIEAVTGFDALAAFERARDDLAKAAAAAGVRPADLPSRIAALQEEQKALMRQLQQARMSAALGSGAADGASEPVEVAGVKLVARQVSGLDRDGLRTLVDQLRGQIKSGVVVLASPRDGKVAIVVGVTADLTRKVPAGQVVKELAPIVGGGGGGRADFAEAGGKDPSRIADLLSASRRVVEQLLSA